MSSPHHDSGATQQNVPSKVTDTLPNKANTERILLLCRERKKMEMRETQAEELECSEITSDGNFNFLVPTVPRMYLDIRAKRIRKSCFIPSY